MNDTLVQAFIDKFIYLIINTLRENMPKGDDLGYVMDVVMRQRQHIVVTQEHGEAIVLNRGTFQTGEAVLLLRADNKWYAFYPVTEVLSLLATEVDAVLQDMLIADAPMEAGDTLVLGNIELGVVATHAIDNLSIFIDSFKTLMVTLSQSFAESMIPFKNTDISIVMSYYQCSARIDETAFSIHNTQLIHRMVQYGAVPLVQKQPRNDRNVNLIQRSKITGEYLYERTSAVVLPNTPAQVSDDYEGHDIRPDPSTSMCIDTPRTLTTTMSAGTASIGHAGLDPKKPDYDPFKDDHWMIPWMDGAEGAFSRDGIQGERLAGIFGLLAQDFTSCMFMVEITAGASVFMVPLNFIQAENPWFPIPAVSEIGYRVAFGMTPDGWSEFSAIYGNNIALKWFLDIGGAYVDAVGNTQKPKYMDTIQCGNSGTITSWNTLNNSRYSRDRVTRAYNDPPFQDWDMSASWFGVGTTWRTWNNIAPSPETSLGYLYVKAQFHKLSSADESIEEHFNLV